MKKKRRRVLLIFSVFATFIALGGYIYYYRLTREPLPRHAGELRVDGLTDTVRIVRDQWGVPHIYAGNYHDLYFAQGFTQAQDRWWQMEFFRHIGNGSLGRLLGKKSAVLATDIFIRTAGFRRAAELDLKNYDAETLAMLQSFADGVNAYLAKRDAGGLAMEYGVLRLTGTGSPIEPWTPADSLVWGKVMAWDLGGNQDKELLRAALQERLGVEMTEQLLTPPWPFEQKPTIIEAGELTDTEPGSTSRAENKTALSNTNTLLAGSTLPGKNLVLGQGSGIGSNNWVISGKLTESGKPLLANDPHLGIQMPSIWYQVGLHLRGEGHTSSVAGFAFAPVPGVIVGHNNNIAWGVTNVNPDVQDLYAIHVHPEDPLQYEWNGSWRRMKVHEETIHFGDGEAPVTIQVRETHLGPIINDNRLDEAGGKIQGFNNENPKALRWTALDSGTMFKAVVKLNRAQNWEEFRNALQYWDVPSQNFVYADIKGNIGYQMTGRIPFRAGQHSGLLPVPGNTEEYVWQGFIPYDKLPRLFNPERGFILTANQAVAPPEYYDLLSRLLGKGPNYVISREWDYGYRAQRIYEMLGNNIPHNISSVRKMLGDNKDIGAEKLLVYLANLTFGDARVTDARNWLLKWDCRMDSDSPQAALYAHFWARLLENLFADQLGKDMRPEGNDREMRATYLLLQQPDNAWWDDTGTEGVREQRDEILTRSFAEAHAQIITALGSNRENWRWGALHTATFVSNPLGQSGIALLERIVNRGPFPASGSSETVNSIGWKAGEGNFSVTSLPSLRMIVDLGDFRQNVAIHTTGQSGHPYSKNYDDLIELWQKNEYLPMLWSPEQVEAAAVNTLVLKPAK
jgi:penicillin amidase